MAYKATPKKPPVSFEKELWNAAVALRGNVAPADYKHYVLPLLFLRYLSLKYEQRRTELEREIHEHRKDYGPNFKVEELLEEPDEYKKANAFMLPEQARWDYLVKHAQDDKIKIIVDDALEVVGKEHPKLQGIMPRIFANSNLDADALRSLITLFSKEVFSSKSGQALDMLGKTYEYFIGNFASTEGARGGEYFTPESVVRVLVECMEPKEGIVFDPACGSGGMFVQSDKFAHHTKALSFIGQESIDTTVRLGRMNLILHGLDGLIELGDSLTNDKHPHVKADFVIANPPFNLREWGAQKLNPDDPRLVVDGRRYAVTNSNANYMWMLHFLHHTREGGTAATVMANGSMMTSLAEEQAIRRALVDAGLVDCIIQLPEKLFAQTTIPVCIWIFSKSRKGLGGHRDRRSEVFFIDARKLGRLKEGSRKQKELSTEEVATIAHAYHSFRSPDLGTESIQGFCVAASLESIQGHDYKLTPSIYVGSAAEVVDDEDFGVKIGRLRAELEVHFQESSQLQLCILNVLDVVDKV